MGREELEALDRLSFMPFLPILWSAMATLTVAPYTSTLAGEALLPQRAARLRGEWRSAQYAPRAGVPAKLLKCLLYSAKHLRATTDNLPGG